LDDEARVACGGRKLERLPASLARTEETGELIAGSADDLPDFHGLCRDDAERENHRLRLAGRWRRTGRRDGRLLDRAKHVGKHGCFRAVLWR
jgi:hypothetical protein